MRRVNRLRIGLLFILLGIAVAGYVVVSSGMILPSAGVQDRGDWGKSTEQQTEIITTVWVDNPYPIDLTTGNVLRINYSLTLNDVTLAEGSRDRIELPRGNTTQTQTTDLRTDRLSAWWVNYIRANETVHAKAHGRLRIVTPFHEWTHDRTATPYTQFTDRAPLREALSRTASQTEGKYTRTQHLHRGSIQRPVTVGAEIQETNVRWGQVDRNHTTVLVQFTIRNPSETVPLLVEPAGLQMRTTANGVRLFSSETGVLTPNSTREEKRIRPGETRTVTVGITMDNEKVDDWFRRHVRNGERSQIAVELQLVMNPLGLDKPVRIPAGDGITYRCTLQTAILEDNQTAATTCGDRPIQP